LTGSRAATFFLLIVLVVAAVALALALSRQTHAPDEGASCGEERWPVKTLSDRDAGRVNLTPQAGSVAELRALPTPSRRPANARVAPTELTTFSIVAQVVEFKIEEDRDVHLIVADPADPTATMIVEFPDAAGCSGAIRSAEAERMRSTRAELVSSLGQPSTTAFRPVGGQVRITGVAFFDFLHGQRGVAPNGIELHPVLQFERLSSP